MPKRDKQPTGFQLIIGTEGDVKNGENKKYLQELQVEYPQCQQKEKIFQNQQKQTRKYANRDKNKLDRNAQYQDIS